MGAYRRFRNEQLQKEINLQFRLFQPEDTMALISCVRDEYGDTYFKQSFYNPEALLAADETQKIQFLVAQQEDGEIVGMLALKRFKPREDMCEIASQIIRREYRGYHIAWPFFQYGMTVLEQLPGVSAVYCLPVLFHKITEVLMERLGLVPCGVICSVFLMDHIRHSYHRDGNHKHPQGIMIKKQEKQSAGVLYVAKEHQEIAAQIYSALQVSFSFGDPEPMTGTSALHYYNDERQQNCAIYVDHSGTDLMQRVREIQQQFSGPWQTYNVFLNVSDGGAVGAYRQLTAGGFFFTGFQPLCSAREIMVLHDPGLVRIDFTTWALTPAFARLRDYIEQCWQGRALLS